MNRLPPRKLVWQICVALLLIILNAPMAASQDKRAKVRISNAGLTITALPLLARAIGAHSTPMVSTLKSIVMSPPIGAAAMAQGDIDYVAGVGPASVAAHPHRFAVARDLVFLGSDLLLDPSARRSTRRCRISKAKRSPSPAVSAAPTM